MARPKPKRKMLSPRGKGVTSGAQGVSSVSEWGVVVVVGGVYSLCIVKMKLKIIQNALSVISFEWTPPPPPPFRSVAAYYYLIFFFFGDRRVICSLGLGSVWF